MKKSELKELIRECLMEHSEFDMNNPEEKREVQIAREIIGLANTLELNTEFGDGGDGIHKIIELANDLIKMHGAS